MAQALGAQQPRRRGGAGAPEPLFRNLRIMVHAEGHMRTHVLRAHVTRHGGKLVPPGDGASCDYLCCDKATSEDKIKELWGSDRQDALLALHNTFISQSVVAGRRLPVCDFVRLGQAPAAGSPAKAAPSVPSPSALGKRAASQTDSAENKNKVAAIFLQQPKGPPMHHVKDKGYVYWWSSGFTPSSAVAAFDMDHTILRPLGGRTHPKDEDDWQFMNEPALKAKLKGLVSEGKCIVLISNQGALERAEDRLKGLENKLQRVQRALGLPLAFYAGYGKVSRFRKPAPGLWEQLTADFMQRGVGVMKRESFFCGDAAGRPEGGKNWKGTAKKDQAKDFSDSDRRFAINAGVDFFTPEQFFLGSDPLALEPSFCPGLDPSTVPRTSASAYASISLPGGQEMVILVGSPGSGKSSLAKAVFQIKGYEWVNQDTLKTFENCLKKSNEALTNGKSVVIDNTNPESATRKRYIDLAKKSKKAVRCVWVSTPRELAQHLNLVRHIAGTSENPIVPDIAFQKFEEKFEPPDVREGFQEVIKWDFAVGPKTFKEGEEQVFNWRLTPWKISHF
eukprot:Tamp_11529.p1 GENE.Tamp_11529~~Tamp_11529.p1  ORF type:complete len:608 (+),score=146.46 Tamp_11529:141-1826(+)